MGDGELTVPDIAALAKVITKGDMESIALGYFEQDWNRVRTHKDDLPKTEEFNRAILMDWKIANTGVNQKKRLAKVLFKAAKESSYVDPQKVEDVLKVKIEDTESTEGGELTDEMIINLAGLITNPTELNSFAIRGLKMTGARVAVHLTNHQSRITDAVTAVLFDWRSQQNDSKEAYTKLCEALRSVGMAFHVGQTLK